MVQLAGGTHFLVLCTTHEANTKHRVYSYRRFDQALRHWDAGTRVSPIFALDGAPPPPLESPDPVSLAFVGPIFPGRLLDGICASTYLSLGLLNVVFYCPTKDELARALRFADEHALNWEYWNISSNEVRDFRYHPRRGSDTPLPERLLASMKDYAGGFLPTARECQTLLATTHAKAAAQGRPTEPVLTRFSHVLRQLLGTDKTTAVEKLQYLVTTNVALTRQLWQTYAGCAPVFENPCHLATHSLFAIGTASTALERLARFSEATFEKAQIPDRLRHLRNVRPHAKPLLISLKSADPFWDTGSILFPTDPPFVPVATAEDAGEPRLPQLTYFSSRDGFRSTDLSLSAPVEVVTACNTPSWTLHTVTHELTHPLIHGILGLLLPDPSKPAELAEIKPLLRPDARPLNLFDQLRAFITFAIWRMNEEVGSQINFQTLPEVLRRNLQEADEILTHVFDYLYHYQDEPLKYVRAVWVSWATVPNIGDRVSRYVTRCLCALHANNLRREKALETTLDTLLNFLRIVRDEFPAAQYIPDAIEQLETRSGYYIKALQSRILLVRFVRYVLYAEEIARELQGGTADAEALKALTFEDRILSNPLAFIGQWAQDREADAVRSVWMLQYLAYGHE